METFILSVNTPPPDHIDVPIPGLYECRSKVFLNMAQSMIQPNSILKEYPNNESIQTLKALPSLNKSGGSNLCHSSSVSTKNNGIVHSECNKLAWSSYDLENDKAHMSHYIVNRYGKF